MRNYLTVIFLLSTGCASVQLAPNNVREKTYTIETKLSKDKAFDKLQSWVATGGGQVRVNDRSSGIVGIRANVPCEALKLGSGFAKDQRLWFFLEVKAEDKKVVAKFTDITASSVEGSYDSGLRPSNVAEVETAARECLEPLKNSIAEKL